VELAGVWQELPRHVRLVSVAPWLLGAAMVLLLLEIFERRSGLLSRRARISRGGPRPPTVAARRRQPHTAEPPATAQPPPTSRDVLREPASDQTAILDALRKARERSRGRLE
jgi:hypothetical protein